MQEVIQHALFLQLDIALLLKVIKVTIRGQNSCFEKRLHLIFIKKHTKSSFLLLKIKSYSVDSYQFIYPSVYFIIPFKLKVKFLELSY